LIGTDAGEDLEVLVFEHDFVLEEFEPGRCCWAEYSCANFKLALGWFWGERATYLHRTMPFVQSGPARGS
jgi:hypothetical protein